MQEIEEILHDIYKKLWLQEYYQREAQVHIKRDAFRINLVLSHIGTKERQITVCDIGAGWGQVAAGFAAIGLHSIMIDDFGDEDPSPSWERRSNLYSSLGIEVIKRDVIFEGIDFISESINVFTCFDALEHFHHSPKRLFHQAMKALKPGGLFVLGVPNGARLIKRFIGLLGYTQFSSMSDWYEQPLFRGHVREPNIQDLKYITQDMGLVEVDFIGRNDQFLKHNNKIIRVATKIFDFLIKIKPSFCSEIYMIGKKPI